MENKEKMTVYDIAKKAGVSVATVSKVMNHRYGVNTKTAEKVSAVLEKNGFTPRQNSSSNMVIGMLLPPYEGVMQTSYCRNLVDKAYEVLRIKGYSLQLVCHNTELVTESRKARNANFSNLSGLLVIASPPEYELAKKLLREKNTLPCVVIGKIDSSETFPSKAVSGNVIVDDYTAGFQLARVMLNNNHRTFCLVAAKQDDICHRHRLQGMLDALRETNIPDENIQQIEYKDYLYRRGNQLAISIACSKTPPPDAFLFTDGLICTGFAMGCWNMNLKIPDCFSMAGFEDENELERLPLPITSMRIPADQIAEVAARALLAQIEHQPIPTEEPIQHILILRNSVKKKNG